MRLVLLKLLLGIVLIIFSGRSFALQLSGTYTLGGTNPDFTSLYEFFEAADDSMSGPVIINIRPGTYQGYTNWTDLAYKVTLQSESLDSTSVIIRNFNQVGTLSFSYDSISFRYLTIENTVGNFAITSQHGSLEMEHCNVQGIYIKNSQSSLTKCSFHSQELEYVADLSISIISIFDCEFNGNSVIERYDSCDVVSNRFNGFLELDSDSLLTFKNNRISDYLEVSRCDTPIIINNYCVGDFELSRSSGAVARNNFFNAFADVSRCTFLEFTDNVVMGEIEMSRNDNSKIANNVFKKKFRMSYSGYSQVISNIFREEPDSAISQVRISFSGRSSFVGNKVYWPALVSQSFKYTIVNNFFSQPLRLTIVDSSYIGNNNFGTNGYLSLDSYYTIVRNNNFSQTTYGVIDTAIITIEKNNYFPYGSLYDQSPTFYDPMYVDTVNLYAQNPQLAGIGVYHSEVVYDIDSVLRNNPPSIGANEICISSDTLNVYCGDSVPLVLCGLPNNGAYSWVPATGLNNPNLANPKASPQSSGWYKVTESQSTFVDSIYLNVIPYQLQAYNDTLINCGDSILLFGSHNASATYQWQPTEGIQSPNDRITVAKPGESTTYYLTSEVPGCGVSVDSVTIEVDPSPRAAAYYNDSCLTLSFTTFSACVTGFYWDFGDSETSDDINPVHTYDTSGIYTVTFIYSNDAGSDTITGSFNLQCEPIPPDTTSINDISGEQIVEYYPNPAEESVQILSGIQRGDYSISDISGKIVKTGFFQSSQFRIDLSEMNAGIYILNLFDGETRLSCKIVKK